MYHPIMLFGVISLNALMKDRLLLWITRDTDTVNETDTWIFPRQISLRNRVMVIKTSRYDLYEIVVWKSFWKEMFLMLAYTCEIIVLKISEWVKVEKISIVIGSKLVHYVLLLAFSGIGSCRKHMFCHLYLIFFAEIVYNTKKSVFLLSVIMIIYLLFYTEKW